MGAEALESYLGGSWSRGHGAEFELVDPTNGSVLATASAPSVDLKAALAFARKHGGPAMRALSYAERAKLLGAVADVLGANRARYEEIAIANSGNTKIDAAIDIDGGIGTLKYYARLGAPLGDAKALVDDKPVRLAKAENFQAIHLLVPRRGVAVHINAFNFPSWGLWEKAACALLSGMPMLAKPGSEGDRVLGSDMALRKPPIRWCATWSRRRLCLKVHSACCAEESAIYSITSVYSPMPGIAVTMRRPITSSGSIRQARSAGSRPRSNVSCGGAPLLNQ
jgi:hypothetical protein